MGQFAWVTLATNDSYALGALVVAHSLKRAKTAHQLAVLITPGVTPSMREKLQAAFNLVQEVNVLDSKDAANLALLSRPELGITFTKLHCWRLTQYEKCVFLDADTLVLQNCDELFEREELSAAPDVGWPDCFNSGVYVFRPNLDTFDKLTQFAVQKGSFDGGDQGLLNSYFSNWAQSDSSRRLPFIYNTCSTACYSYLPAFKQFGENVKILHFIGQLKPWVINFDPVAKKPNPPQEYKHLTEYLDLWWNIFCNDVHPKLVTDMGGLAGALAGLKLGVARSAEQEAHENNCRRNYWEHGNIDYLGKDSFDNIWKRITQTLESKNGSSSSEQERRARTPTPQPEDKLPKDAKKEGVRRISDVSAPSIPTIPVAKVAMPLASFAPIQKVEVETEPKTVPQEQKTSTETKTESKSEEKSVQKKAAASAESKPTVAIPSKEQGTQKQPKTPTVTSPTPPQSPASPSTQSTPITSTKDLSAVHEAPATPPVGAPKDVPKKKDAPKKKK